jgi:hypothetical protein
MASFAFVGKTDILLKQDWRYFINLIKYSTKDLQNEKVEGIKGRENIHSKIHYLILKNAFR